MVSIIRLKSSHLFWTADWSLFRKLTQVFHTYLLVSFNFRHHLKEWKTHLFFIALHLPEIYFSWFKGSQKEREKAFLLNGYFSGNPLQYSCLEGPTDRGAWRVTVYGIVKSPMWLEGLILSLFMQTKQLSKNICSFFFGYANSSFLILYRL